jgi:hypothetical protein
MEKWSGTTVIQWVAEYGPAGCHHGCSVPALGQLVQPDVHVQRDAPPVLHLKPLGLVDVPGRDDQARWGDQHGDALAVGDARPGVRRCLGGGGGTGGDAQDPGEQGYAHRVAEATSVTEVASWERPGPVQHMHSFHYGVAPAALDVGSGDVIEHERIGVAGRGRDRQREIVGEGIAITGKLVAHSAGNRRPGLVVHGCRRGGVDQWQRSRQGAPVPVPVKWCWCSGAKARGLT